MRIGIFAQGQEGMTWQHWTELATSVEEHGFESLLIADHYRSYRSERDLGGLDAFATLAGLAAVTSRVRLGTLVSPVTFRHGAVTAKMATTIDHISGGRFELGLGAGWFEREHREFGFAFPPARERLDILEEQLELIRRQWTEPTALPEPVQQPGPTLIIGGDAKPRSLRIAARWADEYNTPFVGAEECARRRALLEAACDERGRPADEVGFSVLLGCVVGDSRAQLRERAADLLARKGESADPDAWLDEQGDGWLIGDAPGIAERLEAFRGAGVDRVVLMHLVHDELGPLGQLGAALA
jgi:alkanesulfonate monooxygenase SsuD/methylene tetrahydromethanopterin reductase-like flavin-dependent oxidoreductase (luciferase family)